MEGDAKELPVKAESVVMRYVSTVQFDGCWFNFQYSKPQHGEDSHYTAVVFDRSDEYIESHHY